MQIKRRRFCLLQMADQVLPDFAQLLRGSLVFSRETLTDLLCAVSGERIRLAANELAALASLSDAEWTDAEHFATASGLDLAAIRSLIARNALLSDGDDPKATALREGEATLERIGWHPLAATYHRHTAWAGIEGDEAQREHSSGAHRQRLRDIVAAHGMPPTHCFSRADRLGEQLLPLDDVDGSALYALTQQRRTTRAYRQQEWLGLADFSALLRGSFGVRGSQQLDTDIVALRKGSPSGGGLHPVEAYPVVARVAGLEPGIYHYRAERHSLELIEAMAELEVRDWIAQSTIGQVFFAEAQAHVIHVARFGRNFWKYRGHVKAYKAVLMDSAHLSQNFYLFAAERGLGAYVTAAINDIDIGHRLKLDPLLEAAITINGVGIIDPDRNELHLNAEAHSLIAARAVSA